MKQLNEQLKDSIEAKTGTRPEGYALHEILNSASGEENGTLVEAVEDFIANLPIGGTAPTVVNEITWDGTTEGKESVEFAEELAYKVSDDILPQSKTIAGDTIQDDFTYSLQSEAEGEAASAPSNIMTANGVAIYGLEDRGAVICVEYAGAEILGTAFPSAGTWELSIDGHHIASITAAAAE